MLQHNLYCKKIRTKPNLWPLPFNVARCGRRSEIKWCVIGREERILPGLIAMTDLDDITVDLRGKVAEGWCTIDWSLLLLGNLHDWFRGGRCMLDDWFTCFYLLDDIITLQPALISLTTVETLQTFRMELRKKSIKWYDFALLFKFSYRIEEC